MAADRSAASGHVVGAADDDHPPAVVEEPPRSASSQWRTGQRLAAVPAPTMDGQQRRLLAESPRVEPLGLVRARRDRRTTGRTELEPRRPSRTRSIGRRTHRSRGRPRDRSTARPSRSRWATRSAVIGPRRGRTTRTAAEWRSMPSRSSRASPRAGPRAGRGPTRATSVSRKPPPPIVQPRRRGMPASVRTRIERMSPRTSIPRSYPRAAERPPERPRRPSRAPTVPRLALEPVPRGDLDRGRSSGSASKTSRLLGEATTSITGRRIGPTGGRRSSGLVRIGVAHVVELEDEDPPRLARRRGPGGAARQIAGGDAPDGVERPRPGAAIATWCSDNARSSDRPGASGRPVFIGLRRQSGHVPSRGIDRRIRRREARVAGRPTRPSIDRLGRSRPGPVGPGVLDVDRRSIPGCEPSGVIDDRRPRERRFERRARPGVSNQLGRAKTRAAA